MTLRKLRFLMEGDNVPIKPPDARFKWVTLWWRGLHVTPRHWQKSVLEWFHEVKRPCGSPLIMDLMASSAQTITGGATLCCRRVDEFGKRCKVHEDDEEK
ncbi:hypothetical protein Hanom_Chr07g00679301 [Helianthus anomalus]